MTPGGRRGRLRLARRQDLATRPAIASLKPLIGPDTAVVTTQNGVEAPHQVAAVVGEAAVLPGAVEVIAFLDGPGRVRHVGGLGKLTFAEWDSRRAPASSVSVTLCRSSGLAALSRPISGRRSGQVPRTRLGRRDRDGRRRPVRRTSHPPGTRQLILESMAEIQQVAKASGINLPADAVDATVAFMDSLPESGTTSLQRDINAGRPSELEAWTGAVVRLGRQTGTPTPLNKVLYELAGARSQAASGR